jgi:hypothetical protein
MTSFSARENRSKCLGGIGTPSSERPPTTSNSALSVPKKSWKAWVVAPLTQPWPDGWSGNGGVASGGVVCVAGAKSDSHAGSAIVAALPSVSASRIAARGRQECQNHLSFQQLIAPSAAARLIIA